MPYDTAPAREGGQGLDPADWSEVRALGHALWDEMLDWLASSRERPVWLKMPEPLRVELRAPLPRAGAALPAIADDFRRLVLPYSSANEHPRMMGWVNGGGNAAGMLAALVEGVFNVNCGGRDHAAIEVERQVIAWAAEAVGLPREAGGVLVTGSSMANFIAVLVARRAAAGEAVRRTGVSGLGLVAYASVAAHGCLPRGLDMAGLGSEALRTIAVDDAGRMRTDALAAAVAADRAAGLRPFLVVGTAGTVDTGAVDPLPAVAEIAADAGAWFHVDGAFGATVAFSAARRHLVAGIERADSVAFDFHKWAQVPYDAGCVLVRDRQLELDTFAQSLAYLQSDTRGIAGNPPWPRDMGPDLSRSFRALKVWMTLKAYGAEGIGRVVDRGCEIAAHLARRIAAEPALALVAPVALNIVCFRARGDDALNREIVVRLQEGGIAAPSTTTIDGRLAIRAAIFNHRTTEADADALVEGVLACLGAGSPGPV